MVFGLSIIGCITTTTLLLLPESNILDNLSLKVKKVLALTGDVKTIFKLQDVNLSLNKDTSDSFRKFAYVSSYLHLKSFAWKRDCPISSKLQTSHS